MMWRTKRRHAFSTIVHALTTTPHVSMLPYYNHATRAKSSLIKAKTTELKEK
jgi:hypothetical protein